MPIKDCLGFEVLSLNEVNNATLIVEQQRIREQQRLEQHLIQEQERQQQHQRIEEQRLRDWALRTRYIIHPTCLIFYSLF